MSTVDNDFKRPAYPPIVTHIRGRVSQYKRTQVEGNANCYAKCMAQIVTRVDNSLATKVDGLVADGIVLSRSEAVRIGLEWLVETHRRERIGLAITESYRRLPQSEEELAGIEEATRALIEEEPW